MGAKRKRRRSLRASKLTSKYQATVPEEIRKHLHLKKGDRIVYKTFLDGTVILRKPASLDLQYFQALNTTLNEWETEGDEQAYKKLS